MDRSNHYACIQWKPNDWDDLPKFSLKKQFKSEEITKKSTGIITKHEVGLHIKNFVKNELETAKQKAKAKEQA